MRVPQFFDMSRKPPVGELPEVSSGDSRRERTMQRLQIGIAGVVLMILLIGLASVIQNRADQSDATTVPEAAPTTEPSKAPPQNDPLADAGVVPDLPAEPSPSPAAQPGAAAKPVDDAPAPTE